ncbi:MAG: PA14 domain-containing protein [Anaerolineae bacterium]
MKSAARVLLLLVLVLTPCLTSLPASVPASAQALTVWRGEYFPNRDLAGLPVFVRDDAQINFDFGLGSPAPEVPADNFSVRWTSVQIFGAAVHRFTVQADDGVRLWIDDQLVIDQWREQSVTSYTADRFMSAGQHRLRLEFFEATGLAQIRLTWELLEPAPSSPGAWRGEYFPNRDLAGAPVLVRDDAQINFDFGFGSPGPQVPADNFSVRWTSTQTFSAGLHRFTVQTDDGARLWIDDQLVIDQWRIQAPTTYVVDRFMTAGQHNLRLEYFEATERAVIQLSWELLQAGAPPVGPWRAEYFANRDLAGTPTVARDEAEINHDFGLGSPDPRIPADDFSARWMASIQLMAGTYRFTAETDDGVRLYIDNVLVIDQWREQARTAHSVDVVLAGGTHSIRMEYFDHLGFAFARLSWERIDEEVLPGGGNIVTCTTPPGRVSWIKVYRLRNGQWMDINPHGWGPVSESGFLKIDGMPVDVDRYGLQGHPYRVELYVDGSLVCATGDTAQGQPMFRVQPGMDNQTPWGCPAPTSPAQCPVPGFRP